jgi:hypothetical protein
MVFGTILTGVIIFIMTVTVQVFVMTPSSAVTTYVTGLAKLLAVTPLIWLTELTLAVEMNTGFSGQSSGQPEPVENFAPIPEQKITTFFLHYSL